MMALFCMWLGGMIAASLIYAAEAVRDEETPCLGGFAVCALWPVGAPLLLYVVTRGERFR